MDSEYRLDIRLSVLRLLGPNLYGNIPAVLSEMVANAWDADATRVDIRIDWKNSEIEIEDDGLGMTINDINEKYLSVGYEKRNIDENRITPSGRHVMGRKGIGKLAIFSFANVAELHTVHLEERSGFILDWEKIESQFSESIFQPISIPSDRVLISHPSGTKIVLREIHPEKFNLYIKESKLRMQIARRFTILDGNHNFDVYVNGIRISNADRTYFKAMDFIWSLGESTDFLSLCPNLQQSPIQIDNHLKLSDGSDVIISGWVGTVNKPKAITIDGHNVISLYAYGKMVHEDILSSFNEIKARNFGTYIIGEIEADFLDFDEQSDIVIANRREVNSVDPRYTLLRNFILEKILLPIGASWTTMRNLKNVDKRLLTDEILFIYGELNKSDQERASSYLKRLSKIDLSEEEVINYAFIILENLSNLKQEKGLISKDDEKFVEILKTFPYSSKSNIDIKITKDEVSGDSNRGLELPTRLINGTNGKVLAPENFVNPEFPSMPETTEHKTKFPKISPPDHEVETIFTSIKHVIENSEMPDEFKEIAICDLIQARIAYQAGAFKASCVMMGAVLEGIMISVVTNDDVLINIRESGNLPKILKNIGLETQDRGLEWIKESIYKLRFDDLKIIIAHILSDANESDKKKIDEIQIFRNIIHPRKILSDMNAYKTIDNARAVNLLSSLEILSKIITKLLD